MVLALAHHSIRPHFRAVRGPDALATQRAVVLIPFEGYSITFQVVRLHFNHFQLESCLQCLCDFLNVYDGTAVENQPVTLCGEDIPADMTSTGPNMRLVFSSDSSVADLGFYLTWESVTVVPEVPETCGGSYDAVAGSITSPGFRSGFYPNSIYCLWSITTEPGSVCIKAGSECST